MFGKYRSCRKKNGLKVWNEEIVQVVREKKKVYLVNFSKKCDDSDKREDKINCKTPSEDKL